jgi:hypothetical protein
VRCEVLGRPWANYVDQDKTSFESLCDLALLYLGAAIEWLETEYGTNSVAKTEVGPAKLLSIPDFVNAMERTAQRSAGRGAKRPTYRIPHREGLKQMFGDTAVGALRPRW